MGYCVEIDSHGNFRDLDNRVITLRGINLAGDSKLPMSPCIPSHEPDLFFDGDNVSFVGRPFPLSEADEHLQRIKNWGFNVVRYIFCWEAIEHERPGKYDDQFVKSTIELLKKIREYGFYVFMDPHQDVWSRFSGGSGAPMWTLYAAGLDPRNFAPTEAAVVQNLWPDPATYPKMMWATNYDRLACQVMFTLFWAGEDFAPKAVIDGQNIQHYLQDHFINAVKYLAENIYSSGLDDSFILGWESCNEPARGLLGCPDLLTHPSYEKLKKYTSPTPFESILLGSGRAVEVETYDFGSIGPYKTGLKVVNNSKTSTWLSEDFDDSRYGWRRGPQWKLGECIWAQHGVWDPCENRILKPHYFAQSPDGLDITENKWADRYFMEHFNKYADMIRSVRKSAILFCQTPVLAIPPDFVSMNSVRSRMVFTPHYYDGLTLIRKHWSNIWNIDVVGVLRDRYWNPIFGIRIGETSIRNCLRDQLKVLKDEGIEKFGQEVPCLFSEIGIPFDMDDKKAYSDGDYNSQIHALDANIFALESSMLHCTFWVYCACNSHKWGDSWNGEDLSFWSKSDVSHQTSFGMGYGSEQTLTSFAASQFKVDISSVIGTRAHEAFIRPYPLKTVGMPVSYGFDLKTGIFQMELDAEKPLSADIGTEIYLPEIHYPNGDVEIEVTSGRWELDRYGQKLTWWHDPGNQVIRIIGIRGAQTDSYAKRQHYEALGGCCS
ncbi:glycoside hydrolase superfamily [Dipodascopsis uninucleata]